MLIDKSITTYYILTYINIRLFTRLWFNRIKFISSRTLKDSLIRKGEIVDIRNKEAKIKIKLTE
jgi:hypothetical protein